MNPGIPGAAAAPSYASLPPATPTAPLPSEPPPPYTAAHYTGLSAAYSQALDLAAMDLKLGVRMDRGLGDKLERGAGGFLTTDEARYVRRAPGARQQMERLLDSLRRKDDEDVHRFIRILQETGNTAAAEVLQSRLAGMTPGTVHVSDASLPASGAQCRPEDSHSQLARLQAHQEEALCHARQVRGQYQPLGSLDYSRQWQAALATSQTQIAQLEAALDASQAQVTRLQRLVQENNAFHARIIGEKDQTIARLQGELASRRPSPPPSSLARTRPSSPDRRQPHEYRLWAHKALQRMLANPRIDFRESLRELLLCCKYKMMWDPRLKTQLDGVIEGLVASGTLNQSESCGIQTQPTPMGSYGQLIEKLRSKMEAGQERKTRERNASHLIHLVEVLCDTGCAEALETLAKGLARMAQEPAPWS